jgi:hypothetical protein
MQHDFQETRFKPLYINIALLSLVTLGGIAAYSMGYINVQAIKESTSNIIKNIEMFCSAVGTFVAWCIFWDKGFYPRRIWRRVTSLAITLIGIRMLVLPLLPFGNEHKPPIHKAIKQEVVAPKKVKGESTLPSQKYKRERG